MHKHNLAKAFAALVATGALLMALVPGVSAAPLSDAEGAPNITTPSPTGYYIWHTDDGWHLRTHGPGAEHVFDGRLHSDGTFETVDFVKLEADDNVYVTDGGHTLIVHFHTYDGEDGVNFRVHDGNEIHADLKLDGQPAALNQIFLGTQARNPKHNPFTIHF
ncbi:MAG: hypothetical protein JO057_07910 [Chloroflexi bacterium]|nr:hypothetical protein [Chloroflexota bacterium]